MPRLRRKPKTEDPRRVATDTSYSAKGTVDPPKVGAELGTEKVTSRFDIPELRSRRQRLEMWERMTRDDASVDVSLRGSKMPITGGTYYFEPFGETQDDLDTAEFCEFNVFKAGRPFQLVLEDILRFLEDSFSILEKCWELREWSPKRSGANRRKYTMLHKLAYRPALSLKDFTYDDTGGPAGIIQNKMDATGKITEQPIEIAKLVIFSFNKKGSDLEGKSILRTAYKHWYYKDNFYKIDGIQKERHALGIPRAKAPPNATTNDKQIARQIIKNLRTNEEAGILQLSGWEFDFIKFEGELVSVLGSAEHHDGQIMKNIFLQFMNLGLEGSGGGRATSGSHMDMFLKSMRYVADLICEFFNQYLIPQLVGYNFDTDRFPTMKVRNVGETKDLQQMAAAIRNLVLSKAISMDTATENFFRGMFEIPQKVGERPENIDDPTASSGFVGRPPTGTVGE